MDSLVRLSGVTKHYGNNSHPAVDRVRLEAAPGEAMAVMGPSGSGKATLLNLIAGLDRPTRGTVTVAGQRIDTLSETGVARFRRQRIGMIFQFFNLLDDLTVAGNPRPTPAGPRLLTERHRTIDSGAFDASPNDTNCLPLTQALWSI